MSRTFFYIALIIIVLSSCKPNRLKVDVSKVKAPVEIVRFEKELFGRKPGEMIDSLESIRERTGDFFDLYSFEVISIGGIQDPGFKEELLKFVTDSVYRRVADSVAFLFNDFSAIETKLEKAFRFYKYYFPMEPLPRIYTQVSGFNQSLVFDEHCIGISLDKYMGTNCIYYQYLGIPSYKRNTMYPERIVPELFYALATFRYPFRSEKNHLLDQIVYQGKLIYFTEAMCASYPDSTLVGFTHEHTQWCKEHEEAMWTYLAGKKLLYSSDRLILRKFLGDAPHTPDFSSASPGRAVSWIGWQIVRKYMDQHPEISLPQLMEQTDGQALLAASGYHPD